MKIYNSMRLRSDEMIRQSQHLERVSVSDVYIVVWGRIW